MELIVLGSGCFAPPKPGGVVRNPSGYALRLADRTVLFDFGFGNLRQMVRAGLDPTEVSHVFVTHSHLDHVGDLSALLFYFRYEAKPKGKRLTLVGYPGFAAWFRRLQKALAPSMTPRGYRLSVRELRSGGAYTEDGLTVRSQKVPHFAPCQAYRLEAMGRVFVYSGDTAYDERLARFASASDLFVLECTQPASKPLPGGHMTAAEAVKLAEKSGSRRALLSHLSDGSAEEARRLLRGRKGIMLARDLMRIRM